MVTRQEIINARTQISQQEQALQAQRQQLESYNPVIKQSQIELRGTGLSGMQKAQILEQARSQAKEQALREQTQVEQQFKAQAEPVKQQLDLAEQEINKIEALQADYNAALAVADSTDPRAIFSLDNARQKQFYSEIKKGQSNYTAYSKLLSDLKGQELKPIFDNTGKLITIDDLKNKQSFNLEDLPNANLSQDLINRLEKANIITTKTQKTDFKPVFLNPTQTNTNGTLNKPSTSPFWSINKAPSAMEQYKQMTKQEGLVSGTMDFIGSAASSLISKQIQKGYLGKGEGQYYQINALENIGQQSPNLLYFTSAASPLLLATGTEGLASPQGQQAIKENKLNALFPLASIGLGLFGMKSASKNMFFRTEPEPMQNFIAKVKVKDNYADISILSTANKQINLGKQRVFFNENFGLSIGKGQNLNIKQIDDNNFNILRSQEAGVVRDTGLGRFWKNVGLDVNGKPIYSSNKEGQAVYGMSASQNIQEAKLREFWGLQRTSKPTILKNQPLEKNKMAGVFFPEGENRFFFKGGTDIFLRIKKGGKSSLIVKNPKVRGLIKIEQAKEPGKMFNLDNIGNTGLSQEMKQTILNKVASSIPVQKAVSKSSAVSKPFNVNPSPLLQVSKQEARPIQTIAPQFQKTSQESVTITRQPQRLEQKNILEVKSGLQESLQLKEKPMTKTQETTRLNEKTNQVQLNAQQSKLEQRQQLEQKQNLRQEAQSIFRSQTKPETFGKLKPIIFFPGSAEKGKASSKLFNRRRKAFDVQYKKKGRFVTIGKGLPQGKALELGVKATTSTLRQRFRLLPKGETEMTDIKFNVPGNIFTKPKKQSTPLEFVERRGQTLKRGTGEIPEILRAKKQSSFFNTKQKGGKFKWF